VRHITPGCPWENPYAESLIGTLRAYLYPHVQRKKSVSGVASIYSEKSYSYNNRVHWEFKKDEIKTPLGKLAGTKGREMPLPFSLEVVATKKHVSRRVDGQGRISWKRYRLYVHAELAKEKVEIREFFTSLVVTYKSGAKSVGFAFTFLLHTSVPMRRWEQKSHRLILLLCSMIILGLKDHLNWSFSISTILPNGCVM